jgi:diaminopimelate decarboxylase
MDLKLAQHIAAQYSTPSYVYDDGVLGHDIAAYLDHFPTDLVQICYAVKANANPVLLKKIFAAGIGADIVSIGEYHAASQADFIVFSGVAKSRSDLEAALSSSIHLINVESMHELDILESLKKPVEIMLRLNPDIDAKTHPKISTGMSENKFGIGMNELPEYLAKIRSSKYIKLRGIGCHIGSQLFDMQPLKDAARCLVEISDSLRSEFDLKYINLGGGLGVSYKLDETDTLFASRIKNYAEALLPIVRSSGLKLIIEPGRSIVARCGQLLMQVIGVKRSGDRCFLLVDAGMNDFMRTALYDAEHPFSTVHKHEQEEIYTIVGPICESTDVFVRDTKLPVCKEGDFLVMHRTGAYGFVLANNYNARGRPAEVLINGSSVRSIRERESITPWIQADKVEALS